MVLAADPGSIWSGATTHLSDLFAFVAMLASVGATVAAVRSVRLSKQSAQAARDSADEARRSNDLQEQRAVEERVQPYNVRVEVLRDILNDDNDPVPDHDGHDTVGIVGFEIINKTPFPIEAPSISGWIMNGSQRVQPVHAGLALGYHIQSGQTQMFNLSDLARMSRWPVAYTDQERLRADDLTGYHLVWDSVSFVDDAGTSWVRPREGQPYREI